MIHKPKIGVFLQGVCLNALLLVVSAHAVGQTAQPVAAGSASGAAGTLSFTLGQPFAQSDFETAVTVNTLTAFVIEGVQQPFAIGQLAVDGATQLSCKLIVYPNPTVGALTVECDEDDKELDIVLYSLDGKQLLRERMRGVTTLQMDSFATGSYLLVAQDESGNQGVYRIIKK